MAMNGELEAAGFPVPSATCLQIDTAIKAVRKKASDAVKVYRKALREWIEATIRFKATETVESWRYYTAGEDNRRSVAYRSRVAVMRRGGMERFNSSKMRYLFNDLLPRLAERKRAERQIKNALVAMITAEQMIYTCMGVPLSLVYLDLPKTLEYTP
jgi:murein L,D-transpeptidase YafK